LDRVLPVEVCGAFSRPTGMALEQAETFIAKGRTLTLEEFEYAPES
jgi:hypothetical protein